MTRWVNVAVGVWLAVSAFVLAEVGTAPRTADAAAGLALVALSLLAPGGAPAVVLGCWIMIAPAALSYPNAAGAVNAVLSGFAVVAATLHPDARLPLRLRARRPARAG